MRNGNCHEICEKCAQMYINMQRYKEHKQNTYGIPAHTTHNGTHKGGPGAEGGRPTFVGGGRRPPPIMGGVGRYFVCILLMFLYIFAYLYTFTRISADFI